MDWLGSLDSSRDLQSIYAKKFINRLYLVLQNIKILFQKILAKWSKHSLCDLDFLNHPLWLIWFLYSPSIRVLVLQHELSEVSLYWIPILICPCSKKKGILFVVVSTDQRNTFTCLCICVHSKWRSIVMISASISVIILISLICKIPLSLVFIFFRCQLELIFLIGILGYSHHDAL